MGWCSSSAGKARSQTWYSSFSISFKSTGVPRTDWDITASAGCSISAGIDEIGSYASELFLIVADRSLQLSLTWIISSCQFRIAHVSAPILEYNHLNFCPTIQFSVDAFEAVWGRCCVSVSERLQGALLFAFLQVPSWERIVQVSAISCIIISFLTSMYFGA